MSINYTKLAATAKRLIEANGRNMTFYRKGRAAADPTKPWNGPTTDPMAMEGAPVTYSDVKAVFEPIEISDDKANGIRSPLKSTLYVCGDSFPDGHIDLTTLDEVNDGVLQWKICYVFPLTPGPTNVMFTMGLEG